MTVSTLAKFEDTLWTVFEAEVAAPTMVFRTLIASVWSCLLRTNRAMRQPLQADNTHVSNNCRNAEKATEIN